jgi:hypothetical protein
LKTATITWQATVGAAIDFNTRKPRANLTTRTIAERVWFRNREGRRAEGCTAAVEEGNQHSTIGQNAPSGSIIPVAV